MNVLMAVSRRLLLAGVILLLGTTAARAATVKWASAVSGNWGDSTKWDTATVPTSADTVIIDVPGTYTVTINQAANAASLALGAASGTQTLSMPSGFTLTVTGSTSILANGLVDITSGTITGGAITLDGDINWNGGTLSGASSLTVNSGGGITISGATSKALSQRAIDNFGTITFLGTGSISGSNAASITNRGGAQFQIQTEADFVWSAGTQPTFSNQGTLTRSTGTLLCDVGWQFSNSGTVDLQTGSLEVDAGTHTGAFNVSSGAEMRFAGSHTFNAASSLNGAGAVTFVSVTTSFAGTWNLTGNISFTSGATTISGPITAFGTSLTASGGGATFNTYPTAALTTLTISAGTVTFSSGTPLSLGSVTMTGGGLAGTDNITITGTFGWDAGTISGASTLTLDTGCTTTMSGATGKTLSVRNLVNKGAVTWTGGQFSVGDASVVTNQAGATFAIQTNSSLSWFSGTVPTFNNLGTITQSGTTGVNTVTVRLNNDGTYNLQSGTLSLNQNGTHNGTFSVATGNILRLAGGTHAFNSGSSLTGTGTLEVTGATVTMAGTYNLNASNPVFSGGSITFSGTISSFGTSMTTGGNVTFNVHPGASLSTVTIPSGTLTLSTGSPFTWSALTFTGGTIAGTDNFEVSTTFNWQGGTISGTGTVTLPNTCTTTMSSASGKVLSARTINHAGTLNWSAGTFSAGNAAVINNQAGANFNITTNSGLNWFSGTVPTFNNAGNVTQSGTTGVTNIGATFNNDGTTSIQSGTFQLAQGGTHNGSISLAVATILRLQGTHTFNAISILNGSGTLEVTSGTVALNGTYDLPGNPTFSGGTTTFAGIITDFGTSLTVSGGNLTFTTHPGSTLTDVTVSSGTLTLSTATAWSWANLTLSGGTFTGTDNATVTTAFNWSAGTLSGASTLTLGSLSATSISGTGKTLSARTLTNQGIITWTSGAIAGGNAAVINNQAGATINIQTNAGLSWFSGTVPAINNLGTITQSGVAGATSINATFNNDNQLSVNAGELALLQGGTSGGTFTVASGANLRLAGTHSFTVTSVLTGAGTFEVTSGTINIAGTYSITGVPTFNSGTTTFASGSTISAFNASLVVTNGTVIFNSYPGATLAAVTIGSGTVNFSGGTGLTLSTVSLSGGTFTGTDSVSITTSFTWSNGTVSGTGNLNINNTATMTLSVTSGRSLSARTINNAGTVDWNGGTISSGVGTVFNNQPAANFNIAVDSTWFYNLGGTAPVFNNDGIVTKTAGTGVATINAAFHNDGTLNVNFGTLDLGGGGSSGGTTNIASGAVLRFGGGTHTLLSTSTIAGAGGVTGNSGTVDIDGGYNVTGPFNWSAGTINFNSASTIFAIGSVTINSGTVNFSSGSNVALSTVTLAGTLTGIDTLDVATTFDWTGGTLSGTGVLNIQSGAALNVTTATNKSLSARTLLNAGTATWTGGNMNSGQGAIFTNQSGATLSVQGNLSLFYNLGGAQSVLNNQGTITRSSGTGSFAIDVTLNNDNAVNLQTGTLSLTGGGTDNGAFNLASGTTLQFGGGTHTFNAGSSIAGAGGAVSFTSGTVNFSGTCNATGAMTVSGGSVTFLAASTISGIGNPLTISSGTATFDTGEALALTDLTMTGGTLTGTDAISIAGTFTWSAGTVSGTGSLAINGGAFLNINTTGSKSFSARTISSSGSTTWSGGSISSGNGATFHNLTGATFAMTGDNSWFYNLGGTTPVLNNNSGATLTKSAGTGTSAITGAINNDGTVSAQTGTLNLSINGTATGNGAFSASSGATLGVNSGSGTHTLNAPATVSGAGTITTAGTVNSAGTWNVTGAVTVGGTVNFTGPVTALGSTTTISSGATANFNTGSTIPLTTLTLNGTLAGSDNVTLSGTMSWPFGTLGGSGTFTVNSGAIVNMTGTTGKSLTGRTLANNGTINWSGTGAINGGGGAVISNAGTFSITNDTSMFYNLGGATPAFNNQSGGTLVKSAATGITSINWPVSNSGTVDLQSGILRANTQPYTQAAGGTLRLLLGGLTAGTQFGQLQVNGSAANLSGTIDVDLAGAYVPNDGDVFQVATFASRTGDFGTKNLLYPGGGFDYTLNATNITLTASSTGVGISKSGPANATAGSNVTYTIIVNNAGPDPASTVEVTDTLPAGTTFVSVTPPGGWSCSGTGPVVCTIASMPVGSASISLTLTAPAASGTITNNVSLTSTNDTSTLDNTASASTLVDTLADLAITLSPAPASVAVDNGLTWNAQVTNAGPSTATSVTATINLPPGQIANSVTPAGCSGVTTATINCSLGSIASGNNVAITINTSPSLVGTFTAQATTSTTVGDPNPANNSTTGTVAVTGQTIIVMSSASSGNSTLAQAILDANNGVCTPAPCHIEFNLSPLAPIAGALPTLTAQAVINGTTQPGFSGIPLVEIDGTSANPGSFGLLIDADNSTVTGLSVHGFSGPGAGGIGVMPNATGVQIIGNSIYANPIGIDLGIDGATPNDPSDPDSGANDLQNFPVITGAVINGGNLTVTATLDSPPTGSVLFQVFTADGGGSGQGFLADTCLATPITGSFTLPTGALPIGTNIVATVTSFTGAGCVTVASGTSEFSGTFAITGCTPPNATITAASAVCPSTGGHVASVGTISGATYAWTITNGTITSATNTPSITFNAGASGVTTLNVTITDPAGCSNSGTHNVNINANPTASISAQSSVCAGSTGNAASVPLQGGATYAWTITNGTITSATNAASITFTAGASGTVTLGVTVTSAGCTSTGSHNATIAPLPPTAITAPAGVCAGGSFVASVPATAGATYNWTVTNGTITSGNGTNSIGVTAGTTGSVVLNVTVSSNGCSANGTHTTTITPLPPSAITAPATTCPATAGLTASVPNTAGATYAWTITNGTITSASNISSITFTSGSAGSTTLGVTITANGCTSTGTHNMSVVASPTAAISAPSSECPGATGLIASVPPQGGATYAWTITNGAITSASNTSSITFTAGASGTTTLNVTVTIGSCTATGTHNVAIATPPPATITAPATVCANSSGHTAGVANTAGATYSWSIANGTITSSNATPSITFTAGTAGNVTLTVSVTANGCTATGTHTVTVNPQPSATITAPAATCPDSAGLSASVPNTAGATYAWTITNGAITSAANTSAITFTAGSSGATTLNVTVTANGCTSASAHNVAITANPAASITAPASVCPGTPGNTASVPSQAGATYTWTITNGTITSAANGSGITFTAGSSGTTTVSVTVVANGCTSTGSQNVAITPPPNATITAPATVCANSTDNAASVPATAGATYGWSITNGTITSATNANAITFDAGPSGNVVLSVTVTAGGCANSGTHTVTTTTAPAVAITAPASTCPNTAGLTASVGTVAGATYGWSITNGTITAGTGTNAITFTAGPSGATTLAVTVTAGGCTSSATHSVTIVANPVATITAPANVCANATGNTASVAAQAGATYAWTITNGTITAGTGTNSITFTAGASGSVTLGVTVTVGSCTSTGNATIPIVAALTPSITGPNAVCPNTSFTLDAGAGFSSYLWSNGATTRTITVSQTVATTYTVTVTSGTCSAQASKSVTMTASPTAIITTPGVVPADSTGNVAGVTAQAGATYAWTVGNGVLTAGQNTNSITFTAGENGAVEIGVTVTIASCTANGNVSIPIQSAVNEADLVITKSAPASVAAGQTFTYTIAVSNNGPSNATNVVVTDNLPAGLTLVSVNTGWACTTSATSVRCDAQFAVLGNNSPIAITVRAPSQSTTVTNTVSISSATPDPNQANNSSSATTEVVATPTCETVSPSLSAPANNASGLTSPVAFSWTPITGATFELWLVSNGTASLLGTTSSTSLTAAVPSGTSQWYVVARLAAGCDPLVSERRTLTVVEAPNCDTHGRPQIITPAGGSATSPVTIAWTAVPQAIGYRVWMAANGQAAQDIGTTSGALSLTADVPAGTITIFVQALFSGCPPTESDRVTFTVAAPDPCATRGAATLVFPPNNSTVPSSSIEFDWSPAPNADEYRLWVSQNGRPAEVLGTTEETSLRRVLDRGEHVWWIESVYDGCSSTESPRFRFTIPTPQLCGTDRPGLVAPAHNATVTNPLVTFAWEAVENGIGYEVWLKLDDGAETMIGATAATTLQREVPPGELEWFVRARVDRCDARDSQKSTFTYTPPPSCANNERPVPDAPNEDAEVTSPASFAWSAPAGATRYELYVIRGTNAPALAGSSTTPSLDNVALATGRIRWFVRAFFGNNCPPRDSVDQELTIVPTPQACSVLDAPVVTAPGQIASGVAFRIRWTPVAGATSYQLLLSEDAGFANAESLTTSGTEHEVMRTNGGHAPLALYARVRAIDTRCTPAPSVSLYGPTAAIFVLPTATSDASLPASTRGIVTFTIELEPELAGQTFSAVPTQPWLTVTPASGVVGPTGTTLTVTADTAGLPLGASLGGITITTTTPAANGIRSNGSSTTTKPVTISLVTPVTPAARNTPPPDALIIPAVANATGINAQFQSDVRVTNASAQVMKYQLTFTPSGEGLTASKQTTLSVDPGRTVALDDVLKSWFGTGTTSTTGTLEVRPLTQTSTTAVTSSIVKGLANLSTFASSRTFNATSNGTYGQYIPAIPFASFVGKAADNAAASILSLQQIAQSSQYRTNLGLVEATGESASLLVSVFGQGGTKLTSFPVELKGGQHTQLNSFLVQHGITSLNDGRVEVQVTGGNGKVTAYASVLDQATSDPLLVTPVSLADDGNTKWVVPGVADLSNGLANWQTDLRVFNATAKDVDATLSFHSQNGGEPRTATITIPAGQVRELDKTLPSVFNATNDGGAVHISTSTAARLIATARTYNQTTSGTYGQFISAVTPIEAAAVGTRALQILQVEESHRYRSNIGLAEVSGKPVTLEVSIIPPDAKITAVIQVDLKANEFRQLGGLLRNLGPEVHNARVTVRAISGEGRVTAYASVVDMLTQDPTFVPAQ